MTNFYLMTKKQKSQRIKKTAKTMKWTFKNKRNLKNRFSGRIFKIWRFRGLKQRRRRRWAEWRGRTGDRMSQTDWSNIFIFENFIFSLNHFCIYLFLGVFYERLEKAFLRIGSAFLAHSTAQLAAHEKCHACSGTFDYFWNLHFI